MLVMWVIDRVQDNKKQPKNIVLFFVVWYAGQIAWERGSVGRGRVERILFFVIVIVFLRLGCSVVLTIWPRDKKVIGYISMCAVCVFVCVKGKEKMLVSVMVWVDCGMWYKRIKRGIKIRLNCE